MEVKTVVPRVDLACTHVYIGCGGGIGVEEAI